jgi:hypothetical protein
VDGDIILNIIDIASLSLIFKNDFDGCPTHHFIITVETELNGEKTLILYSSWLSSYIEIRFARIQLEFVMIETDVYKISYRHLLSKMLDLNNLILVKNKENMDEPGMYRNLEDKITEMVDDTYVIHLIGITNHLERVIGSFISYTYNDEDK